jgi:hypothetical protein
MPDWSLGVAHTAHLGAILFGMVIGGLFQLFSQKVDLGQTLSWVTHAEEAPVTLTEN